VFVFPPQSAQPEPSPFLDTTKTEETKTYPLQVHILHRLVHPFHNARHRPRDLLHRYSGLHSRSDSIDTRAEPEEVERLVLLADDVGCVNAGTFGVALLKSL
jgi:hypothetical protein